MYQSHRVAPGDRPKVRVGVLGLGLALGFVYERCGDGVIGIPFPVCKGTCCRVRSSGWVFS